MKQNYILLITVLLFSIKGIAQYSVTPIPHQVYVGSLPVQVTNDDSYSSVITLPFSFDFYGVTYNQLIISTNGYLDFRTNLANSSSPFYFSQTIPNTAFSVKNSILGNFQDLYNNTNSAGSITYGVSGNAPYRKFVVHYNNNSFFACTNSTSSFQIILNETTNIIDVQLIDKQVCASNPNSGSSKSVCGLINLEGSQGIAPPNRNTGYWTAFHEGWRFNPQTATSNTYSFIKCDDNLDGFEDFNLAVVQNDIDVNNPSSIQFYPTLVDAQAFTNQLTSLIYTNVTPNTNTIYARVLGTAIITNINLSVLDCNIDFDLDTVPTSTEDINVDTNLANDDTDADGLANFNDNDDDGDLILTNVEYVFPRNNTLLDTDNDGILNYIDNDDDGDGVLTINEDYNGNNNPADDDTNGDNIPDYLQMSVNLATTNNQLANQISIYPNPATDIINIDNKSQEAINNISIYSIKGDLIKVSKSNNISISDIQNGVYFVKIQLNKTVLNYKFVKN
jgi:Secretion system C-terminal sorting domain